METRKIEKSKKLSKAQHHLQNHAELIIKYLKDTVASRKLDHIGDFFQLVEERLFFNSQDEALENIFTNDALGKSFEKKLDNWKNKISISHIQTAIVDIVDYYFLPIMASPAWEEFLKQQAMPARDIEHVIAKIKGAFAYKIQSACFAKNVAKFSERTAKSKILNLTIIYSSINNPAHIIDEQQIKLKNAIRNKLLPLISLYTVPEIIKNLDKWKSSIKKEESFATLPDHNDRVLDEQIQNILLIVIETKLEKILSEIKNQTYKADDKSVKTCIASIREANAVLIKKLDAPSRINELYLKLQSIVNILADTNHAAAKILAEVVLSDIEIYAKSLGKNVSLVIVSIADDLLKKYCKNQAVYPSLVSIVEKLHEEKFKIAQNKFPQVDNVGKTEILQEHPLVKNSGAPERLQDSPLMGRKISVRHSPAKLFNPQNPLRSSISLSKMSESPLVLTEIESFTPETLTKRAILQHTLSSTSINPVVDVMNLRRTTSVNDSDSIFSLRKHVKPSDVSMMDPIIKKNTP